MAHLHLILIVVLLAVTQHGEYIVIVCIKLLLSHQFALTSHIYLKHLPQTSTSNIYLTHLPQTSPSNIYFKHLPQPSTSIISLKHLPQTSP